MRLTNFISLAPLLFEHRLITGEEYSKLRAPIGFNCTKEEKARFFYFEVLDTKGGKAYTLLHHCLKLEEDHLGHRDLVKLLDKDTQQIEEQLQDPCFVKYYHVWHTCMYLLLQWMCTVQQQMLIDSWYIGELHNVYLQLVESIRSH